MKKKHFFILLMLILFSINIYSLGVNELIDSNELHDSHFALDRLSKTYMLSKVEIVETFTTKYLIQYFVDPDNYDVYHKKYKYTEKGLEIVEINIPIIFNGKIYKKNAKIINNNFISYNMKVGDSFFNKYEIKMENDVIAEITNKYILTKGDEALIAENIIIDGLSFLREL